MAEKGKIYSVFIEELDGRISMLEYLDERIAKLFVRLSNEQLNKDFRQIWMEEF